MIKSSYVFRRFRDITETNIKKLDIINCSFAYVDASGDIAQNDEFYEFIRENIVLNAKGKVILSIAPESKWAQFTSNDESLENFINQLMQLLNHNGFDGVDLDWEHPKSDEIHLFSKVVKRVYDALAENKRDQILTAAITGGKWQLHYYDLETNIKYLDYINVMTYSMSSNSGFYQSALYPNEVCFVDNVGRTFESCSYSETLEIFTKYVPKEKLIFGIPFYGQRQVLKDGVFKSPGALFYNGVKELLANKEFDYYFDDRCKVPFLYKKDKTEFISYDDCLSIKYKCNYIKENKIGGVMFWEYGCDENEELLNAILDNAN